MGSWFLPESPRWQIAQNRHAEAREFIIKHHANGDANHPVVAIEMQEIEASLAQTRGRSFWAYFDLRSLFKSRARLYRLMLVVAMAWFGQFSGNNVVSYYLPIMVENVGITSTSLVLLLNAFYAITGWIAATIGGMSILLWISSSAPLETTADKELMQLVSMILQVDARCSWAPAWACLYHWPSLPPRQRNMNAPATFRLAQLALHSYSFLGLSLPCPLRPCSQSTLLRF